VGGKRVWDVVVWGGVGRGGERGGRDSEADGVGGKECSGGGEFGFLESHGGFHGREAAVPCKMAGNNQTFDTDRNNL